MLWHSLDSSDAMLLMVSLPVSALAILAAIPFKATSGACRKLGGDGTSFSNRAIAAKLRIKRKLLLAIPFN